MFKRNWREIEPRLEYKRTCYLRDFFRRKDNLSLEGGFVKAGRQEEETQGGDAIYIPNGVAHGCRSTLKDQPLNVFCVGVAIPHDAQVWTEEDLPDAPIRRSRYTTSLRRTDITCRASKPYFNIL